MSWILESIDPTTSRAGKWTKDEDSKLKDAVRMHGGKNWIAISALIPGGKNWGAISALVPGRARCQCKNRWHNALDPSIDRASGRKGKWTAVEDSKLKDAVQTHGGKNWIAISALVPGRTKRQCEYRWQDALDPSIDQANGRTGRWTEDEVAKLKDAVLTHGGKNWVAIAALVPGRTKNQCNTRWQDVLNPSIAVEAGSTGKWRAVEDSKLRDAVQMHGGKNRVAIATLVPGRTKSQYKNRWHHFLDPNID
jgi:uncharacterized protein (DUF2237 family)